MQLYLDAFKKLFDSILGNDFIIFVAAIITFIFVLLTKGFVLAIKKRIDDWKRNKNVKFSKYLLDGTSRFYTLFVTMISIFPLLGMLGTVVGLLGLDLESGDMNNIKNNFFIALTSTAWGIVFSVIFKLIHAFVADDVEEQIEIAKKLSEESE